MVTRRGLLVTLAAAALAACEDSNGPPPPRTPIAELALSQAADAPPPIATGGGHYDIAGLVVQFAFSAVQLSDGKAAGQFHITADEGGGLTVDVAGAVTCLAVDPVNRRAWIGAVVTKNTSTDPDLQADIHQPGRDVWFRVLDAGEGSGVIDRTTFTGFQGAAGFETSAEYCAGRPWPADNARTWPVTGNISVAR